MLLPCNNLLGPLGRTRYVASSSGVESAWCLSFDGSNDWVNCGTSSTYTPSTASYSFWVKTSNAGSGFRNILCRDVNVGINCSSNVLGVYDWSGGGQKSSGVNIADGSWHHVVFIKQAGVANGSYIYVDGVLRLTTTYASNTGTGNFAVGSNSGGGENFAGLVDDVRIYSRIISSTEVTALYTNTSPPTDVTAYLPLEEGTGTSTAVKDSTGATIATATLTNGPVWHPQTPPKLVSNRVTSARSLSFDGSNDWVNLGASSAHTPSTASYSIWLKTSNAGSGYREILCRDVNVGLLFSNNVLGVYDWSGGGHKSTGVNIADGIWHHVVFVKQAGVTNGSYIYVDGTLRYAFTYASNTGTGNFAVGSNSGGGENFAGLIDDPRIFSRALSATDIQKLCRGQNPTVNDPVGWWPFDELSGPTAVDSGSGGNNGTHVNGPTISTDVPAWLSA